MEDIQKLNVTKGKDGKYPLYDADGNVVEFSFPVDAKEALASRDKDGKPRYFTYDPTEEKEVKKSSKEREPEKPSDDNTPKKEDSSRRRNRRDEGDQE